MSDTGRLQSQFYITIDGQDAPAELMRDLEQITVESSLHLPAVATLVLYDPHLRWIDHASLEPGKTVEIAARVGRATGPIFDGEIVEIEPEFEPGAQRLVVRAFDRLHRLARGRYARSFQNVTDGDLVRKIAAEVGLQSQAGPTAQVHQYVFQANQTNLAFLQQRAAALGYLLFVKGKTLHFAAPAASGAPIDLAWGATMYAFRPRMTTVGQVNDVTVRGWNPASKQAVVGQARKGNGAPQVGGQRSGGDLAKQAFNLEAPYLVAERPIRTQAAADLLAQATADRHGGRFIEAEGECLGLPGLVAGSSVKISGVGDRFSGTYFVTAATHTYRPDEGYTTHFSVSGLHAATLLSLLAPEPELPGGAGLVIGIVTDNQDPDGLGRVKVKYPWLSADHTSDWARVISSGGGATRGMLFLPEINDEVLVGFEQGDIHHPYVLGGLWNGQDAPPKKNTQLLASGKVQQRAIHSRVGHTLTFHEGDGQGKGFVRVQTAGGKYIDLTDTGKGIAIKTDKSTIKLDDQGNALALETQGNLTIKATGKVSIEGQTGVEMKSSAALDIQAQATMKLQSNAPLQIQSNALLEVKSSAVLNIQGTLVKIN